MQINIRDINSELPRRFSGRTDLSSLRLWGETAFPNPVDIQGSLESRHGQISVGYTVRYSLSGVCSRCLAPILREGESQFSHPVQEQPGEDAPEDIIPAPGGMLELGELAGADLLLELTQPLLCDEDCKGLCPQCGADLNEAACDCPEDKKVDPRFAALLDFMNE